MISNVVTRPREGKGERGANFWHQKEKNLLQCALVNSVLDFEYSILNEKNLLRAGRVDVLGAVREKSVIASSRDFPGCGWLKRPLNSWWLSIQLIRANFGDRNIYKTVVNR